MSEMKRKGPISHGHTCRQEDGRKESPTYRSWMAMKSRCNLEGRPNADRYKDRGVKVCDRWMDFANFLADMGERPAGTTLDRWPDMAGDYAPGNCRWATPCEQARNTRHTKLTLETAIEVAALRLRGVACKKIAKRYGISESLPREIAKGRAWKDALAIAQIHAQPPATSAPTTKDTGGEG